VFIGRLKEQGGAGGLLHNPFPSNLLHAEYQKIGYIKMRQTARLSEYAVKRREGVTVHLEIVSWLPHVLDQGVIVIIT
jgi:hypothetical protein